jgi:hypothetical protein
VRQVAVTSLSDGELRQRLVDLERARTTLEAAQADIMCEVTLRARVEDDRLDALAESGVHASSATYLGRQEEFVTDEIAALLRCTRVAAASRLDAALVASRRPVVADAWRRGQIDGRKVTEICSAASLLDDAAGVGSLAVPALVDAAIIYAGTHTGTQLRSWLARRVIAADPSAAERRRRRATEERRVVITPATDGMSELWAWLPSVQARQIQQILTEVAQSAGADDLRSMDQRRADLLVDLLCGRVEPPMVQLSVTVPADVLAGECDEPGWLSGCGPITADQARELLGVPTPVSLWALDPMTGAVYAERPPSDAASRYRAATAVEREVRARDMTCRFPGCRRAALGSGTGTDLDHTVPWPAGSTDPGNLAVLCRRHHRLKHTPGWEVTLASDGAMTWCSPGGATFTTHPWEYATPTPPDPADDG